MKPETLKKLQDEVWLNAAPDKPALFSSVAKLLKPLKFNNPEIAAMVNALIVTGESIVKDAPESPSVANVSEAPIPVLNATASATPQGVEPGGLIDHARDVEASLELANELLDLFERQNESFKTQIDYALEVREKNVDIMKIETDAHIEETRQLTTILSDMNGAPTA